MRVAAPRTLGTPRLTLRPLEPDDAEALVAGVGNYDVSRWLSALPYPYRQGDAAWFIEKTRAEAMPVWAICDAGGLVGVIGAEDGLGYWLARPAWRKGYAFEAARAVTDHWFGDMGQGRLLSAVFHGNDRSAAVLKALGFRPVAEVSRRAGTLSQDLSATQLELTRDRWRQRAVFRLATRRLRMAPLRPRHARPLQRLMTDPVVRGATALRPLPTVGAAGAWIAARSWRGYPDFVHGVFRARRLIGVVGCSGSPVAVSCAIAETHWGQGLGTEAMAAFLPEVFDRFPVNRVFAECFEDCPRSRRMLANLGFERRERVLGNSNARLEPAPVIKYALSREDVRMVR